jgi:hypothetical protein
MSQVLAKHQGQVAPAEGQGPVRQLAAEYSDDSPGSLPARQATCWSARKTISAAGPTGYPGGRAVDSAEDLLDSAGKNVRDSACA